DRKRRVHQLRGRPCHPALRRGPDPSGAEVAVEEAARVLRKATAAVAVAAGDRAAERVIVFEDRERERAVVAAGRRVEAGRSLHEAPAVVLAAGARGGLEVHLFTRALADVRDEEIAGLAGGAGWPGGAQTV